ncbi:hypothetical protein [Sorangium sp. So ce1182]|uniref:hypothetical protein n=1 Tax=Sorangium sp. So ce1182 TaxID=3133334 RepID=UPI003F5FC984
MVTGVFLSFASDVTLLGQLVSADDGSPVARMEVAVTSTKAELSSSPVDSELLHKTDAPGHFELDGNFRASRRATDPRQHPAPGRQTRAAGTAAK